MPTNLQVFSVTLLCNQSRFQSLWVKKHCAHCSDILSQSNVDKTAVVWDPPQMQQRTPSIIHSWNPKTNRNFQQLQTQNAANLTLKTQKPSRNPEAIPTVRAAAIRLKTRRFFTSPRIINWRAPICDNTAAYSTPKKPYTKNPPRILPESKCFSDTEKKNENPTERGQKRERMLNWIEWR